VASGLLWGVGAVSSMLGIATPTLRTWDRRYGLGPSQRTEGGHRRYDQCDIARVQMMRSLMDHGVPAQHAASLALSTEEVDLQEPLDVLPAVRASVPAPAQATGTGPSTATAVNNLVSAAEGLDAAGLARAFAQVFERRGVVAAWSDVLVPALQTIGQRWRSGDLGVESEHLVSERLATELRALLRTTRYRRVNARPVLLAGAPAEQHGLPMLALELALATKRINCLPLGTPTPARALAAAVVRADPGVVFVWARMPYHQDEDLLRAWPEPPRGPRSVVLGGPGWDDAAVVAPPGVTVTRVHDLPGAMAAIGAAV